MPPFIDLSGRRFERLVAIRRSGTTPYGHPLWECVCDCGATVNVLANSLRKGATKSCGCLHRDAVTKHGQTGTAEFTVWQMMKQRCENKSHVSFASYGGRGIVVCERWRDSFENFLADMGRRPSKRHTLDRTDNNGPYAPDNCAWRTPLQQGRNKRNNHYLEHDGERLTIGDWCRKLGMKKNTLLNRLARGLSTSEALTRPVAHKTRRASGANSRSQPETSRRREE